MISVVERMIDRAAGYEGISDAHREEITESLIEVADAAVAFFASAGDHSDQLWEAVEKLKKTGWQTL